MANLKKIADELKEALDRIEQIAKNNPLVLPLAISDAKHKADELCRAAQTAGA